MQVLIVGEDAVTRSILKRLFNIFKPDIEISPREEPVRGGSQIKKRINNYIKLAQNGISVAILIDADTECPPSIKSNWLGCIVPPNNFLFRIATDEAESWLLADRDNLSTYLKVGKKHIPLATVQGNEQEISFSLSYKSSLYLMKDIAVHSKSLKIREQLTPRNLSKKGPEYNSALIPFIQTIWNPIKAQENSSSLKRAVDRIKEFHAD